MFTYMFSCACLCLFVTSCKTKAVPVMHKKTEPRRCHAVFPFFKKKLNM